MGSVREGSMRTSKRQLPRDLQASRFYKVPGFGFLKWVSDCGFQIYGLQGADGLQGSYCWGLRYMFNKHFKLLA